MYNSIVLRKRSTKSKGEWIMKKKWFVVMMLLVSLLAAGCGRKDKIERNAQFIDTGYGHTVGLKADGTIVATRIDDEFDFGQCDVDSWKDIVSVSAGGVHTVGLKADGTVVATALVDREDCGADCGQCEVSGWTDIIAISAGDFHTVGLKSNGTVVSTTVNDQNDYGFECGQDNVGDWNDIVAISAGDLHTVGLKSDGTVVAVGSNEYGQCEVSSWTDIVAVSAGGMHTVGLKADGTVVSTICTGDELYHDDLYSISNWKDIVAISAGYSFTAGLKSDGSVLVEQWRCSYDYDQWGNLYATYIDWHGNYEGAKYWTDVVAITTGNEHIVGLKSDGTAVAVGDDDLDDFGQCEVSDWADIKLPSISKKR